MIRSFFIVLTIAVLCLTYPIGWLVGKIGSLFDKGFPGKVAFFMLHLLMELVYLLAGCRVTVTGAENISPRQPVVYVLNHRSMFDIVISLKMFRSPTGFIAKKELGKIPLFAAWMRMGYCLFLDRSDIRNGYETIMKGIDYINSGISMAIFPEGTRNKGVKDEKTSLLEFHPGSFKLVQKTRVPLIPVTFYNTEEIFETHRPTVKSVPVKVDFGAPILYDELSKEDRKFFSRYVQDRMQETLNKLAEDA